MAGCAACSNTDTHRAHVKDKAVLISEGKKHDFFNIIHLCPVCHHNFFDEGRMALLIEEKKFLVLKKIPKRIIEERDFKRKVSVKPEYIEWKNEQCHYFLKAELRKRKRSADNSAMNCVAP